MRTMADELRDRRLSHASRWHLKPVVGPQESLVEHSAWVARIAMLMAESLAANGVRIKWRRLMEVALTHDDPELITGDMPGHFKRRPDVKEAADAWEIEAIADLYEGMGPYVSEWLRGELFEYVANRDKLEHRLVKMADLMTALCYAEQQQSMGNAHFAKTRGLLAGEIWSMIAEFERKNLWRHIDDGRESVKGWIGAAIAAPDRPGDPIVD